MLCSHHGERNNARNNARCTQARKATHGLDGQHQDADRTLRERDNQNDRGQIYRPVEKVRPWCGQPSDRGRLKNRTAIQDSKFPRLEEVLNDVMTTSTQRSYHYFFEKYITN